MVDNKKELTYKGFTCLSVRGLEIHGDTIRGEYRLNGVKEREAFVHLGDVKNEENFIEKVEEASFVKKRLNEFCRTNTLNESTLITLIPTSKIANFAANHSAYRKTFGEVADEYLVQLESRRKTGSIGKKTLLEARKNRLSKRLAQKDPGCEIKSIKTNGFMQLTLSSINVTLLKNYRLYLQNTARLNNGKVGYSIKTISNIFDFIKQVLNYAVESEYLNANPTDKLQRLIKPKLGRPLRENEYYKPSEQKIVFDACVEDGKIWLGLMFLFGCWTGLRKEELLALAWEDVDFEKRVIKICRKNTASEMGDTKTELSNRNVELNEIAFKVLNKMREFTFYLDAKEEMVMRARESGFVSEKLRIVFMNFSPKKSGVESIASIWNETSIRNVWERRVQKKSGIKKPLAATRHSFATYALSNEYQTLKLAYLLGHTDERMIRQRYGELTDFFGKKDVKIIEDLVGNL